MVEHFRVEPTNPGEVLGCAGLAWLAAREWPNAECGFVQRSGQWHFQGPFPGEALGALVAEDPATEDAEVRLEDVRLDWWNPGYGLNQPFKFWAGQQTAKSVLTNLVRAARQGDPAQWLEFQAPTTGRLGVDPQGTWDSLGLGWSVNEHAQFKYLCRPFVELLAFLALQRFPVQGNRAEGFRYHLWQPASLGIAVLAFAGAARHSTGAWQTTVADSGSNKYLKPARFMGE